MAIKTRERHFPVKFLLGQGADVNAKTDRGETILCEAAIDGDLPLVELLLRHQADVNLKGEMGKTPIYWASRYGHKSVVRLLLERGADVNDVAEDAGTVLHTTPRTCGQVAATGWALLIGINHLAPPTTEDRVTGGKNVNYSNLGGCVNDILLVEEYLREVRGIEPNCIYKLLASQNDESSHSATYANIIGAMKSVTERAAPGDLVYIHFSGHGITVPTAFPTLKGAGSKDGVLVPSDINCGGQYLRDLEIGFLLSKMVDKGLVPTLVLDCSYPFDGTPIRRGTRRADRFRPPQDTVAPTFFSEIVDLFSRTEVSWFPEPRGYTIFAACPPNGQAKEFGIDNKTYGLFTHCLVDRLKYNSTTPVSSGMLYRQVRALMRKRGDQTPVLEGESDRAFFGAEVIDGSLGYQHDPDAR